VTKPQSAAPARATFLLPRWCYGVIVLIALVVFYLYGVLKEQLYVEAYESRIEDTLRAHSEKYVTQLDHHIQQLLAVINDLSKSEQAATALLAPDIEISRRSDSSSSSTSASPLRNWALEAKSMIPGATAVELLSSLQPYPNKGNYIGQQLFEQARVGKTPAPTAGKIESWRVYIARPVQQQGTIVGVLMVEIDPDSIAQGVAPTNNVNGSIDLLQQVGHFEPTTVFSNSQGDLSNHSVQLPTRYPHWTLQFTGSRSLLSGAKPTGVLFYSVFALLCALALVTIKWLITRFGAMIRPKEDRRAQVDPMDDLFTEKYLRPRARNTLADLAKAASKPAAPQNSPPPRELVSEPEHEQEMAQALPLQVFRDYDIRGKAGSEITATFARLLGQVLAKRQHQTGSNEPLAVCCDGRLSSPELKQALIAGITGAGCNVIDLGATTTPLMNFALATMGDCQSGVMVTASHNPKEDNGFKIIIDNQVLSSEAITALHQEMTEIAGAAEQPTAPGSIEQRNLKSRYIDYLAGDLLACEQKIAIDCGNGIAGTVAPELFRRLGCEVHELFTEVDGHFPNHDPDPTVPMNLDALIKMVTREKLDIGLAFDGDGDRVVAVTASGKIVWPDELLMIFARDIITRAPGTDIIFDVKSSKRLRDVVTSYGGRPMMWKTGHANIRRKVRETGAPIGGEFSGHIFFNDRWFGFDDGIYSAARLLEIMSLREQSLEDIVGGFTNTCYTPEIKIAVTEGEKQQIIKSLQENAVFGDAHVNTIDGLRVEYPGGWGLIRASNTSAALTLRFEADSADELESIMDAFKKQLSAFHPELPLDF
jgi:phosphomannomutase / phosphoglucomutase